MLDRFANVIYWLCNGLAALSALIAIVVANNIVKEGDFTGTLFFGVLAGNLFGIGRAVRYVIAGR